VGAVSQGSELHGDSGGPASSAQEKAITEAAVALSVAHENVVATFRCGGVCHGPGGRGRARVGRAGLHACMRARPPSTCKVNCPWRVRSYEVRLGFRVLGF
jgi:hypothetical protein